MAAATMAAKISSTGKERMPQKQKMNSTSAPRLTNNKANKNGRPSYNNTINVSHQSEGRLPKSTHVKPIPNYLKPTVISSTHAAACSSSSSSSGRPSRPSAPQRRASPSSTMAAPPATTATARRRLTPPVNKPPSPSSSSSSHLLPRRPSTAVVSTKARASKRAAATAAPAPRTPSMMINVSQGPRSSVNQDTRAAAAAAAQRARRLLKLAMAGRMRNAISGPAPLTLSTILEEDEEECGSPSSSLERKDKGTDEEAATMVEEKVIEAEVLSAADSGAMMDAATAAAESQRSRVKALAGAFGGAVSFLRPESTSGRQEPPVAAAM